MSNTRRAHPTVEERLTYYTRQWHASIDDIRSTETSLLGFGACGSQPIVLKVVRKENSEEWRCGEVLEAFRGEGMIRPLEYTAGAVLLPRLRPGHDLTTLCLEGRDDEATEIIASLLQRMSSMPAHVADVRPVDRLQPEFGQFRNGAAGFIPASYVDRAEELFAELCRTQRDVRLLHGDLHHYNVLFGADSGWIVIDPWGALGEIEFEVGAALRNPVDAPALLGNPRVIERRLRIYEAQLKLNRDRALKWAFSMTVLAILWPFDAGTGQDLRASFAIAARSMHELLK